MEAGDSAFVTGGSGFIGGRLIGRLTREGAKVRALARSDSSAATVEALGAEPVKGDLEDEDAMRAGAEGCKYAFHAAAKVEDWGDPADFERLNVEGTNKALRATKAAGVERFVHVGTEAALFAGDPLINADESAPLRPDSKSLYPATKAKAERAVRSASADGFETVVIRPRFVWGPGDTTVLPAIVEMVKAGKFRFIGGGHHRTSTTPSRAWCWPPTAAARAPPTSSPTASRSSSRSGSRSSSRRAGSRCRTSRSRSRSPEPWRRVARPSGSCCARPTARRR